MTNHELKTLVFDMIDEGVAAHIVERVQAMCEEYKLKRDRAAMFEAFACHVSDMVFKR